ncbi:hypothetical protein Gohar_005586 [Gossypium harknessii]|uniref:Bifunctional inhibitor/plant lipid transfer protein/seed storage helical domain-containing protein n=1 Tax=Gossypium harknessii TaxID=34285 RepID=A0A7J9H8F3_9ROSI|nr:hypothetical protein [Gossypium harknessii]
MTKLLMVVIYVVLGTMATVTDGQATCAQKLVPGAPYRNNSTAKPQNYCCNPIREAVANELPCLCNLYKDPTLLAFFNVTVAEALRISRECGITTDLSACNAFCFPATATSPSSAPPRQYPSVHLLCHHAGRLCRRLPPPTPSTPAKMTEKKA